MRRHVSFILILLLSIVWTLIIVERLYASEGLAERWKTSLKRQKPQLK